MAIAGVALAAAAGGPASAAAPAPLVEQMVVFRSGEALTERVVAREATVRVAGRRCAAGAGTALAALVRSRPGRLRLRDFGSCSRRARDGAGLFVAGIAGDHNRGQNGWVYKVGRRLATGGAADPAGPFGAGRLRPRRRVTWFYCRLRAGGCQRTLEVQARAVTGGLRVAVRAYDDEGRGAAVEGASVSAGGARALSGPDGVAALALAPGRYRVLAKKRGEIRSFAERVEAG